MRGKLLRIKFYRTIVLQVFISTIRILQIYISTKICFYRNIVLPEKFCKINFNQKNSTDIYFYKNRFNIFRMGRSCQNWLIDISFCIYIYFHKCITIVLQEKFCKNIFLPEKFYKNKFLQKYISTEIYFYRQNSRDIYFYKYIFL